MSFIPLVVTISVFVLMFLNIDKVFRDFFNIDLKGLGIIIAIIIITGIGYLSENLFAGRIMYIIDKIFSNAPFVKLIYNSIGDLIKAFVGNKKVFKEPVIVTIYPESGAKILGFVTTESLEHLGLKDHVVVYMPQSYNFAGQTLIFPRSSITPIKNIASSDLMTFIVSAGIAGRHEAFDKDKK